MKKTILFALSIVALIFVMESCKSSPKLMTESEIAKRVDQLTALEIDSLNTVLEEECDRRLPGLVAAKRDSIIASMQAVGQ